MRTALLILMSSLLLSLNSMYAQSNTATISGLVMADEEPLAFVTVALKQGSDSSLVSVTITDEEGRFSLTQIPPGSYLVDISFIGYITHEQQVYVGELSDHLDLKTITLKQDIENIDEVVIAAQRDEVSSKMDKMTFSVDENISQSGGSVLQSMENLPGVVVKDGKVTLRGNENVTVLIDGKQTALTGFNSQSGLDNIPASSIEKIEIINNPSSKYDANGSAGIINIVYKKEEQNGLNGKVGIAAGVGALWRKRENLPTIRPQYQFTPKANPSFSLNYRKNKVNLFFQGDYLFTQTLNKNEFVTRTYDDGTIIKQQTKRNRDTHFATAKAGIDWNINDHNTLNVSGMFGSEKILDHGDEPFFNADLSTRYRLWQFLEDELKTTVSAMANYQHKFKQPGHTLNLSLNYTFHRENEQYFFDNIYPTFTGKDAFKLLSDEHVIDLMADYVKPLKNGRIEAGMKFRRRIIPTNMEFKPGLNSPLDSTAGGKATYNEIIPALYGTYIYESKKFESEIGLRMEYVDLKYEVDPNHNTYKSDGYSYIQPFPNARLAYKINERNKISLFYARHVDRPREVDIRIFPKYDDAEIIKVGNPGLSPQFTQKLELGYKTSWDKGYYYGAIFASIVDGTITRISSTSGESTLIYAVFQNAGRSYNTGIDMVLAHKLTKWYKFNLNLTGYYNQIDAFTVTNQYPTESVFTAGKQTIFSGNVKLNNIFDMPKGFHAQLTLIYLAPDIIPQGKVASRFTMNIGLNKSLQKGKGEVYLNATDLLNTMIIRQQINGDGFSYTSNNYYETQVIRIGYNYKF